MSALDDLEALLAPSDPADRDEAWRTLADLGRLFDHLSRACSELRGLHDDRRQSIAARWARHAADWKTYHEQRMSVAQDERAREVAKNKMARPEDVTWFVLFMQVAARTAAAESTWRTADTISDAVFLEGLAGLAPEERVTLSVWGRLLADPGVFVVGHVRVPVPLVRGTKPAEGYLGQLDLTVLRAGTNSVLMHPADALNAQADFRESMRVAFEAARDAAPPSSSLAHTGVAYDAVWRLQRLSTQPGGTGQPITPVRGPSAGGAAARGWWHALYGLVPDDEVVVSAEVAPLGSADDPAARFRLIGIDTGDSGQQVQAKVLAVAQDPRFDTLVMVDDERENRRFVDPLLGRIRPSLRIVWLKGAPLARGLNDQERNGDSAARKPIDEGVSALQRRGP